MAKQGKVNWTEKDFEDWCCKTQTLPNGERVLVIAKHKPLKRVVDLVALDSDGGLVFLEVKNETATRAAVGQSLEYLAQYADTSVEDLEDDYRNWAGEEASLAEAFKARFGHSLSASARRRVFLVAPRFDATSSMAAEYLTKLFLATQVSYHLVAARRLGRKQFELTLYKPPIRPARDLQGFVTNARGRIFYVLEEGPTPILWNVGRRTESGELRRTSGNQLSPRAVRAATKSMILLEPRVPEVSLRDTDTTWVQKTDPNIQVRVIAAVRIKGVRRVVMARFVNGVWRSYRQLPSSRFHRTFTRAEVDLPGWNSIVSGIQSLPS